MGGPSAPDTCALSILHSGLPKEPLFMFQISKYDMSVMSVEGMVTSLELLSQEEWLPSACPSEWPMR